MKEYYKRSCLEKEAFVLVNSTQEIAGVVGFNKDAQHKNSTHVSSVGMSLEMQGQGIFFAFLFEALAHSKFAKTISLTGTTTAERLLLAAKRYQMQTLGSSWSIQRMSLFL